MKTTVTNRARATMITVVCLLLAFFGLAGVITCGDSEPSFPMTDESNGMTPIKPQPGGGSSNVSPLPRNGAGDATLPPAATSNEPLLADLITPVPSGPAENESLSTEGTTPEPPGPKTNEAVEDQPPVPNPANLGAALPAPDASWFDIPHGKGEHFMAGNVESGLQVVATLSRRDAFDPIWNRRPPAEWGSNELTVAQLKNSASWLRLTHARADGLHQKPDANWDVPHSPFVYKGWLSWLRFQRRFDPATKTPSHFTIAERFLHDEKGQLSDKTLWRLPNLADSPRPCPDQSGVLFRVFLHKDERSELQFWKTDASEPAWKFGDGEKDFFSRPLWIDNDRFVVIRAEAIEDARAYRGEVLLVAVNGSTVAAKPIDSGLYPVDTCLDPFVFDGSSLFVTYIDGGARAIRVFRDFPKETESVSTESVVLPAALLICEEQAYVVSNNEVKRVGSDGTLQSTGFFLPFVPKASENVGEDVIVLVGMGPPADQPPGEGFDFTLVRFNADKGVIPLTNQDECRAQLMHPSWLVENSTYVKRIHGATDRKRLINTCLIYEFDVKVQSETIKEKKGTMVELYQSPDEKTVRPECIRTEDNLGGPWVIKAYDGKDAYIATDETREFKKSRGNVKEILIEQMAVRRMLILADVASMGPEGLSARGSFTIRHPESGKTYETHSWRRLLPDGRVADYWFDRNGEHHDLVCVELYFPMQEGTPERVALWLNDFKELPDLSARNAGVALRIPGQVRGYGANPNNKDNFGRLLFTATFVPSVTRPTYRDGNVALRSGYNMPELDSGDFGKSYELD